MKLRERHDRFWRGATRLDRQIVFVWVLFLVVNLGFGNLGAAIAAAMVLMCRAEVHALQHRELVWARACATWKDATDLWQLVAELEAKTSRRGAGEETQPKEGE